MKKITLIAALAAFLTAPAFAQTPVKQGATKQQPVPSKDVKDASAATPRNATTPPDKTITPATKATPKTNVTPQSRGTINHRKVKTLKEVPKPAPVGKIESK